MNQMLRDLTAAKSEIARLLRENSALRERLEKHGEFPDQPIELGSSDNMMAFAKKIVWLAARGDKYLQWYMGALRTADELKNERSTLIAENSRLRLAAKSMIDSGAFSKERLADIFESVMKTGAPF